MKTHNRKRKAAVSAGLWLARRSVDKAAGGPPGVTVFQHLWFLGLVSSYTIGGLLHVLLIIAVILLVVRLIQGRRVV